jgi:hypothetical protein
VFLHPFDFEQLAIFDSRFDAATVDAHYAVRFDHFSGHDLSSFWIGVLDQFHRLLQKSTDQKPQKNLFGDSGEVFVVDSV